MMTIKLILLPVRIKVDCIYSFIYTKRIKTNEYSVLFNLSATLTQLLQGVVSTIMLYPYHILQLLEGYRIECKL